MQHCFFSEATLFVVRSTPYLLYFTAGTLLLMQPCMLSMLGCTQHPTPCWSLFCSHWPQMPSLKGTTTLALRLQGS